MKGGAILVVILMLAIALLVEGGCGSMVNPNVAIRAVEDMGFTDVKVVKRDVYFVEMLGGSKSDNVRFTVTGTNPAGKQVTLHVYAGWPFKGATIRTR